MLLIDQALELADFLAALAMSGKSLCTIEFSFLFKYFEFITYLPIASAFSNYLFPISVYRIESYSY